MKAALHAEWTKLRSVSGPGWLVLATAVLTLVVSAAAADSLTRAIAHPGEDLVRRSLAGIQLGQAVVAILAVMMIGDEYGTGMIHATFAAIPRRIRVLAAKATLLTGVVVAAGILTVPWCLVAGRAILISHGFGTIPLDDAGTLRAVAGSIAYLGLIALLALGIATVVRDSATAIGIVLGLLYLFPIVAGVVTDPHWKNRLNQIGPATAGLNIQATRNLHDLPISPWGGLAVLAAWAAGALLLGGLVLRFRDA